MKRLFVIAAVLIVGSYGWYRWQLRPQDALRDAVVNIDIPRGASVREIGALLRENGMLRSSLALGIRAQSLRLQHRLQAGHFALSPSMDVDKILDVLTGGKPVQLKVTIPEGFTVGDIDAMMVHRGLTETGAVIACARKCDFSQFLFLPRKLSGLALSEAPGGRVEGYLYPDTYFVAGIDFDAKAFLERLLSTFEERVIEEYSGEVASSKRSWHKIVTMASLIEEETRTDRERPIVAGILWKRFDAGRGLDVDATLRYVLGKPTAALTKEDLQFNSPYNTRRNRGLPPGPIANPGIASIRAALRPQESPYWYYLHDANGKIRYAVTNDEHNENKARYLR